MAERLALIRLQPDSILDWWSFLGAGADVLAATYPKARRIAVEPDAGWVRRSEIAASRPWWSALPWRRPAAEVVLESAAVPAGAQLIWSNMMLHAVADPPALFERWEGLLGSGGFVMLSCLGPGTLRELRALYMRLGWPDPTAPFIDMHDLGDMLLRAGFADPVMDQETLTLRWSNAEAMLAELRLLGRNTNPQRASGLRAPRWRERLVRELDLARDADGTLGMSFEVAYGHAFKAAPRAPAAASTSVSLDAMRELLPSRKRAPPGA